MVDAASTPAGRTLGQGGYLLFGNEQDSPNSGMDHTNFFGGEMYKLNVFSRMLTTSEIEEMSRNMCDNVEEKYGSTRYIKWEDVIQLSRNGNVNEKDSGCLQEYLTSLKSELTEVKIELNRTQAELNTTLKELASTRDNLDGTEERLNETLIALDRSETRLNETEEELEISKIAHRESETRLNETQEELESSKIGRRKTETKLNETLEEVDSLKEKLNSTLESKCLLNTSVTSHYDFLYAPPFYGEVLTQQKLQAVRNSLEKLGKNGIASAIIEHVIILCFKINKTLFTKVNFKHIRYQTITFQISLLEFISEKRSSNSSSSTSTKKLSSCKNLSCKILYMVSYFL